MKTQTIRLADIFLIGPAMVAIGLTKKPAPLLKGSLIIMGILTVLYNLNNYLEIQSAKKTP